MVDAYMSWSTACTHAGDRADMSGGAGYSMTVYDTFGKFLSISPALCAYVLYVASYKVVLDVLPDDPNLPSAFVRQGAIPSSPSKPTVGFATRVLELFRVAHSRCPHLSQQAFVKSMMDLHSVSTAKLYYFL